MKTFDDVLARLESAVRQRLARFQIRDGYVEDHGGRCPLCCLAWLRNPAFGWRWLVYEACDVAGADRDVADPVNRAYNGDWPEGRRLLLRAVGLADAPHVV